MRLSIPAAWILVATFPFATNAQVEELIIGETVVGPGVSLIFEGAIKDDVTPRQQHLGESDTDIHIEARITWSTDERVAIPAGAVRGGFVAYLAVYAEVENERTGEKAVVTLLPHLNLADNFHYARNMGLPGHRDDLYTVRFSVAPPGHDVALHRDWRGAHGEVLFESQTFEYSGVDFEAIANATRS